MPPEPGEESRVRPRASREARGHTTAGGDAVASAAEGRGTHGSPPSARAPCTTRSLAASAGTTAACKGAPGVFSSGHRGAVEDRCTTTAAQLVGLTVGLLAAAAVLAILFGLLDFGSSDIASIDRKSHVPEQPNQPAGQAGTETSESEATPPRSVTPRMQRPRHSRSPSTAHRQIETRRWPVRARPWEH